MLSASINGADLPTRKRTGVTTVRQLNILAERWVSFPSIDVTWRNKERWDPR